PVTTPPPSARTPAPRRRGDTALAHDDRDGERDQPDAPEDVAEEVRGVDDREVERREHAHEDQRRGRSAEHREPAPGEAAPEGDDDEHGPRGGEQVAERLAD